MPQTRNDVVHFPFRMALGEEDQRHEPQELRLLTEIHEEILCRLRPDLAAADTRPHGGLTGTGGPAAAVAPAPMGASWCTDPATTNDVIKAAVENFGRRAYGECVTRAVAKGRRGGGGGGGGGGQLAAAAAALSCCDLKRLCKQCLLVAQGLHDGFLSLLPEPALSAGLERLAENLTLDVAAMMSEYQLHEAELHDSQCGAVAFREGGDEDALLKLHRRCRTLRRALAGLSPGLDTRSLAGATAPILQAWLRHLAASTSRWVEEALRGEVWQPVSEGGWQHRAASLVKSFAPAQRVAQEFVSFGLLASHGACAALVGLLGELCTQYAAALREAAEKDQAERSAAITAVAGRCEGGPGGGGETGGRGGGGGVAQCIQRRLARNEEPDL